MPVGELTASPSTSSTVDARRLFLVWQDPETRAFAPVGALVREPGGAYAFRYIRRALELHEFRPLASFPELDQIYRFSQLPPFFENRIMSSRRPDYAAFIATLDLSLEDATPFEVLARTGGGRATDTFHVVADPERQADGSLITRFLAHGLRYLSGADERAAALVPGQRLLLRREPTNPVNPRALLMDAADDEPVGYVPDWMLPYVYDLTSQDPGHALIVERVNPAAPVHLRLLCRLEAIPEPGYRPFSTGEFSYVSRGNTA